MLNQSNAVFSEDRNTDNKDFNKQLKEFKYKFGIFLLLVFAYLFFLYYLGGSIDKISALESENENLQDKKERVEIQISQAKSKLDIVEKAKEEKDKIVRCINKENCEGLEEKIHNRKDSLKTFFLISQLSGEKMSFDQKTVLENIYEFLVSSKENINIISFGNVSIENKEKGLYKLPLTLNIDFDSKDSFLSFLERVEEKIDTERPVYYEVESVNYDVMNYRETQTVNISMNILFYDFSEAEK